MRVVIVIHEGFQLLDMAGPADVFTTARLFRHDAYRVELAAPSAGAVMARGGVTTMAEHSLDSITGDIDTLIVAGGLSVERASREERMIEGVARLAGRARRVASVCSGALLLAEAGLLDGKRVTTHWVAAEELAARHRNIQVDPDSIYIKDGRIWTSAGVTAGIDLALALVAEDHGHEVARDVARGLVVYLHRPGGQSQFSTPTEITAPSREPLRDLLVYIDSHPTEDLSVPALADRAGMSERHFSRVFTEQSGLSPGRYVERSRAEAARRLLEATDHPLDTVARLTGLGAPETLYRVFRRHWRVSPGDYRRRFHSKKG